jgi:hypothetical protein
MIHFDEKMFSRNKGTYFYATIKIGVRNEKIFREKLNLTN